MVVEMGISEYVSFCGTSGDGERILSRILSFLEEAPARLGAEDESLDSIVVAYNGLRVAGRTFLVSFTNEAKKVNGHGDDEEEVLKKYSRCSRRQS